MGGLIVHEWVSRAGGSERVLDVFSRAYPDADILCLWNDAPGRFPANRIRETLLARTPLRGRKAMALPVMPMVWSNVKTHRYDWVLSSSHAFAHQIVSSGGLPAERHFAYVHTPARYVWTPELDGRGTSLLSRAAAAPLRAMDRSRAQRHRNVAANSSYVRARIRDTWQVDADVIHPPVEVSELQSVGDWSERLDASERALLDALPETYVLGASRFIPYKRLDLVIAAGEAGGVPVVLAGGGPERAALVSRAERAGVPVHFVDDPGDALLRAVMQRALAFVFPPVEDFGIMPVEAMALGTPVVVGPVGGARESVIDGVTGVVVASDAPEDLAAGIERAWDLDPEACRRHARGFGTEQFVASVRGWMSDVA
ncbi:glycosyltransferase family 4 protein [Agromyces protaetiae]|uniref:Glycosyltransferase family 4 protein n=1 Tax=Agromyces protaetiae TaxID=2509455 RepID=A0A4P6F8P2_9MICO|nr:glycosyltransferase [Agromyces protaetiae]QAY72212.1 glycosyltransferase family 4 protein [Agromyces protaetiae]